MTGGHIAVIDIGKTNVKLALVDSEDLSETAVVTQPNKVVEGPPYPHFDVERIWAFLLEALKRFGESHGIAAISIATHGAAAALIAEGGGLVAPVLDYEHAGPDEVAADYNALRPAFSETGSPRLPHGLNLGAQIHWLFWQDQTLRHRTGSILTYPQYWAYRLTGNIACDYASLGCHTDLWNPFEGRFSTLVESMSLSAMMPPARAPGDVLGSLCPRIVAETGLGPETPVYCGIHDSNASLLPHIIERAPPFSVVSTGTWVIAMTIGGTDRTLDPKRDTLVNVNALGAPVPSARFMGGRSYEIVLEGQMAECDRETLARVADTGPMLMPSVVPNSGPFQGRPAHWIGTEPAVGTPERSAAVAFYLAMMTAECLTLTGHAGPVIVEGPFARNLGYCQMLASAMQCPVLACDSATGTSQGAAMLALKSGKPMKTPVAATFVPDGSKHYAQYALEWRKAVSLG